MSVKRIFLSVICLSCFLSAHAGQGADSVRIYYRAGYRYVEPGFRDNRAALDRLVRYIGEARSAGRLERISIRSYASPDGANRANELLSERRADSLSSWLVRHGSVPASLIDRQAAGIAWDELRAQVAASGMLYRDEVLDVLDNTPVWIFDEKNQVVGGRKQRLMDLRGGEPYRYMLREFFPDLRSSVVVTLYFRSEETPESTQPPAVAPPPAPEPGLKPAENDEPQPATVPDTAAAPERTDEAGEAIPALIGKASPEAKGWTPRLKEVLFPAIAELRSCIHMAVYMLENLQVKEHILDDPKYDYLFSVEVVNNMVLNGVPFREAYKKVGIDIENGNFKAEKTVHHTHEGSIGNLCTDEISALMQQTLDKFHFDRVDRAETELVK